MIWVAKALVLAIHERQLAKHGGTGGVRDDGLLESARLIPSPRAGERARVRGHRHPGEGPCVRTRARERFNGA